MDLFSSLLLTLVGLLAGTTGGLLGIGGGIVMIPAMVFIVGEEHFGPNSFHLYKFAAITASIVVSIPSALRHHRARAIIVRMVPAFLPFAVVGVVLGVLLSTTFVGEYTSILRRIFGGMLILSVLIYIWEESRARRGLASVCNACPMPHRRFILGTTVGLPAGMLGGLLGVGGGIWAVPVQRQLFGVHLKNAIANSSVIIFCVSIVSSGLLGASIHRMGSQTGVTLSQGLTMAALLAPGAIIGGWMGAGLTHRLPTSALRIIFQLVLGAAGLRLLTN